MTREKRNNAAVIADCKELSRAAEVLRVAASDCAASLGEHGPLRRVQRATRKYGRAVSEYDYCVARLIRQHKGGA